MQYDYIINKIHEIYKTFQNELSESFSAEIGVPRTEQPVLGYSQAYSKMFFNYAVVLLHDKMLEKRKNISTFNDEVDFVLDKLARLRPMPRNVLDNYITNKEKIKSLMEKVYAENNVPYCVSKAVSQLKTELSIFFEQGSLI